MSILGGTYPKSGAARSSALLGLIARLRGELAGNRRASLGLLGLLVLAAGYGLLSLDDAVGGLRASYADAVRRLDRLAAAGQEREWPARAAASATARQALEARLWKGESEGIVRADLQDWVTHNARTAGLDRVLVKIDVTGVKGMPANFRQLSATVNAVHTEAALIAFLDRVKAEPRLLVVDHLLARTQPLVSMEAKLLAYAVVEGPAK